MMGWRPAETRAATLPDLVACYRGWLKAQGINPDNPSGRMTRLDYERLKARLAEVRAA